MNPNDPINQVQQNDTVIVNPQNPAVPVQNNTQTVNPQNYSVPVQNNTNDKPVDASEKKVFAASGLVISGINLFIVLPSLLFLSVIVLFVILIGSTKTTPNISPGTVITIFCIYAVISVIVHIIFIILNFKYFKFSMKNPVIIGLVAFFALSMIATVSDSISRSINLSPGEYVVTSSTYSPSIYNSISIHDMNIHTDKTITLSVAFVNKESINVKVKPQSFYINDRYVGVNFLPTHDNYVLPNETYYFTVKIPSNVIRNRNITKIESMKLKYYLNYENDQKKSPDLSYQFQIKKD